MEEWLKYNYNKVILVTGGSRGIGAGIVKLLATNGYRVVLNYNKSEELAKKIKQELKEKNIEIDIIKADVSEKLEVKRMIDFIIGKYNRLDVLINNAGIAQEKLFLDIEDEEWEKINSVNLNSVYYCTKNALPHMLSKKEGCIINISSIWGIT